MSDTSTMLISDYLDGCPPVETKKTYHSLTPEQNVRGTPTTLPCPNSEAHRLVVRENRATGHTFLGCDHYPECTGTAEIVVVPKEQQSLL